MAIAHRNVAGAPISGDRDIGEPNVEFVDAVLYGEVGGDAAAVSILLVIA